MNFAFILVTKQRHICSFIRKIILLLPTAVDVAEVQRYIVERRQSLNKTGKQKQKK
jgi:hypothetical protein